MRAKLRSGLTKILKALSLAAWIGLSASAAGEILGPTSASVAREAYLIALTWQDLVAGLLAGGAAIWAGCKAYGGAVKAAKVQASATMINTRELRRQNAEMIKDARYRDARQRWSILQRIQIFARAIATNADEKLAILAVAIPEPFSPSVADQLRTEISLLPMDVIDSFESLAKSMAEVGDEFSDPGAQLESVREMAKDLEQRAGDAMNSLNS